MKVSKKEFEVEFFKEKGFVRKKCPKCGDWFWTLNKDQVYCNDAPCIEYTFYDLDYKAPFLTVSGARSTFIGFFKKHGHTPVEPKPVVARWREDLYLTIASIVDFQPFVTDGVVPPPANPLVVSQPCIRLEDIDNVGKTAGRHLTSFEMGGHHAFNYPDKYVYWKDETVRYAFKFFTEELGVRSEDITFKESWWEGGGNAGPCFEVTVGGLELATLVFMQYKVLGGQYVPMPLKIVDTGYGIERIAWFSQKAPTGFHAVYRNLVTRFFDEIGVEEPSEDEMYIIGKYASLMKPEVPETIEKYYSRVAEKLGLNYEKARRMLINVEKVFAVLDHTKTLSLMLADGIVPSNTGEGYLARLVIRRALRALAKVGAAVPLNKLVKYQVEYWSQDFPRLRERADYILEVVSLEEERFRKTLEKGISYVKRLIKRKGRKLTLEDLVELYDSHGIPPDIVEEVAREKGVSVTVPSNFFSIVAKSHAQAELREEKAPLPEEVVRELEKLKPTELLFHKDPYMKEFSGKVVYSKPGLVVLDRTAFYAEGGGQLSDVGKIIWKEGATKVIHVVKIGDIVVHKLEEKTTIPIGTVVKGIIDWNRRSILMKHHTSTHIILGAARRVLGEHVWQAGAEKRPDKARLDITHHKPLTKEEIRKIEELANKVVLEGRKVTAKFMDRNEAEAKYGLKLYQGGVPPGRTIRVVEVENWDVEACFGTHVSNTREIGLIKIINVDRIQDGVVRLEYVSGERALEYMWKLEDTLENIAKKVSSSLRDVELRIEKLLKEYNELKRELNTFKREWINAEVSKLLAEKKKTAWGYIIVGLYENKKDEDVLEIARKLQSREKNAVIVMYNTINGKVKATVLVGKSARDKGVSAINLLNRILSSIVKGKGGGKEDYAAASGSFIVTPEYAIKYTYNLLYSL